METKKARSHFRLAHYNKREKGGFMKSLLATLLVVCTLGLLSGCHSGTMKGVGSDVEKLGQNMQ